jgi:hypothetical protein
LIRGSVKRLPAEELETWWDGSHRECDGDLLGAPATAKRQPPAEGPPRSGNVDAFVRAALLERSEGLTLGELARVVRISSERANGVLYRLKHLGEVVTEDTGVRRRWGRTLQRYRLTARGVDRARGANARGDVDLQSVRSAKKR